MLNLLAAAAIAAVGTSVPVPVAGTRIVQTPAHTMQGSSQLTVRQKKWFGHAIDDILRGAR